MSTVSRRRRRMKRLAVRRTWDRIGRDGALVAQDVWERLCAAIPRSETTELHRLGALYGGVRIEVSAMLAPGTIMPLPKLRPLLGLDWFSGTYVRPLRGEVGYEPPLWERLGTW